MNDPDLHRILFNRANAKFELRDYEGALEDYDAAIQCTPHPFRDRFRTNFTLIERTSNPFLLRFEDAIEDYDKHGSLSAYFNKGNVLVRLGHFDEALQCYDKWAQEKKQKGDSFSNRDAVKKHPRKKLTIESSKLRSLI